MARPADAAQIDLGFSHLARAFLNFRIRVPPAISRASASTCSDNTGSEPTGKLNPCRKTLRAARARPYRVRGPVLAREFSRLALTLSSLVNLTSSPARPEGRSCPCLFVLEQPTASVR